MSPRPPSSQSPPAAQAITDEPAARPLPPIPLLALLMLLLPVAAIGFTLRQRALAAASAPSGALAALPPVLTRARTTSSAPPVPDPFAVCCLPLGGPGVFGAVRLITLSALEEPDPATLVVLPRADARVLFGVEDDELLDDTPERLFLPGTLDAALAFLETELSIRESAVPSGAEPRLLLVADCEHEAARLAGLLARHPGAFAAVILGDWPDDRALVDEEGRATAPPPLAGRLPRHVPSISRPAARQRLAALATSKEQARRRQRRRRR